MKWCPVLLPFSIDFCSSAAEHQVTPQELYDELVALDSKITIEDVRALDQNANMVFSCSMF